MRADLKIAIGIATAGRREIVTESLTGIGKADASSRQSFHLSYRYRGF